MVTRAEALRRARVGAALFTVCALLPACAPLNALRGIKQDYRNDGLAVLEVHVTGPGACVSCGRMPSSLSAPVAGATVIIRGPRGAAEIDTLSLVTDGHGEVVFEGVKAGSYVMDIKPPPGFPLAVQRFTDLPANAKRSVKYRLDGSFLLTKQR
jgi:hypothetical protein